MTHKTPKQSELAGTDTVDRANHNAKLDQLEEFRSDATGEALRTNQGVKIADNQNTLKAGDRGPSLLEDFIMREKITHFDHERIPERIVHRSEEHTSELQSLMRISYAVFCLKKKHAKTTHTITSHHH